MLREIVEWEAETVLSALHAIREWVHPTTVMMRADIDLPRDDLGRVLDEPEVSPPQGDGGASAARRHPA